MNPQEIQKQVDIVGRALANSQMSIAEGQVVVQAWQAVLKIVQDAVNSGLTEVKELPDNTEVEGS